jgi:hypothetical protein
MGLCELRRNIYDLLYMDPAPQLCDYLRTGPVILSKRRWDHCGSRARVNF